MKTMTHRECTAERLANAVGERTKSYLDVGLNALNTVSGKARQIGQNADGYVHDNPWMVIGAATGVGFLIGFLVRSHRRS